MFNKILIANRGEIACRIIHTAKRLGITTVAVYSKADKHALHVKMADEAYYIGAAPSSESYLNINEIINVALASQAEAIHPGYGFLSENADFVDACQAANLRFIGPSADAIRKMGEKNTAKHIMESAGVPVIPGYHGSNQQPDFLKEQASNIGFPVLIKAVAGGGGKGMRVVENQTDFENALLSAKSEAKASFGDEAVLLEKYLADTRHIELQIFADGHGNAVYLFERDCSIQRRHQKILEEAPAFGMTDALRKTMGVAAINAARAIHYEGAGTIEFLLAPDHSFYFMEMNTRLQVEHPVTEKITGLDLVEWQLRVADGEFLPITDQSAITLNGHAIEVRIYAENPEKNFTPATGRLAYFNLPAANKHVRIDTGVIEGDEISVYYDPLIAKLIIWDKDRDTAIAQLKAALGEFHIAGVNTNIALLADIVESPGFIQANFNTQFIEKTQMTRLSKDKFIPPTMVALAAIIAITMQQKLNKQLQDDTTDTYSPWFAGTGWRLNLPAKRSIHLKTTIDDYHIAVQMDGENIRTVLMDGICYELADISIDPHSLSVSLNSKSLVTAYAIVGSNIHLFFNGRQYSFKIPITDDDEERIENSGRISAPMPGAIVDVPVTRGQQVTKGERLIVIEAMKMQHTLYAPDDGIIKDIFFNVGDLIEEGAELVLWEGYADAVVE